jgi:peptidoglycan hydrolase FlgJ
MTDLAVQPQTTSQVTPERREQLREVARDLEASFLAEMLRYAGSAQPRTSFGGGVGEEQFTSFLRTEQARAMAEGGGIGLAESLFNALVARDGAGS